MVRTNDVFDLIGLGWFALLFFGGVGLVIGIVDGYIPPSQVPGGITTLVVGYVAVAAVLTLAQYVAKNRLWVRAGKQAGLTPVGLSLRGEPLLTGKVRDRPVEVRTYTRTYGQGESKNTQAYTSVEATLRTSLSDGVVVSPETQQPDGIQFNAFSGSTDAVGDGRGIDVTGAEAEAFEEAIDETGARDAVDDVTYFGTFYVGDAVDAVGKAIPDSMGGGEDVEREDDEASTVTHVTEGTLYDAKDMKAQVEAAVALAEAAESMSPWAG